MKWRLALRLGRVSNLPTVWTNVLAGVILSGAEPSVALLLPLLMALSCFYVGGMYLNDAFDREIDAIERPERPIPAGEIGARAVFAVGFALLGVSLVLLVAAVVATDHGRVVPALVAGAALAALVVYYDANHKGNVLAPMLMAGCRALVYVVAGFAAGGHAIGALLGGAAALFCYVAGLTYVAAQENLHEPKNLWPLAVLTLPLLYCLQWVPTSAAVLAIFTAFAGWIAYALSFVMKREARDVPAGVVRLIAGICLLDAVLMAAHGSNAGAALALVALALTRLLQRFVPGT